MREISITLTKNNNSHWVKSLMAGIMIGLGAAIYKEIGGAIGASLFSIGLLTICMCDLWLYTGRIGSCKNIDTLLTLINDLIINIVGVLLVRLCLTNFGENMFVLGVFCGILMQIAVTGYKKGIPLLTIMCICAFILSGYKHCIATCYTLQISFQSFIDLLFIIMGNSVGSKLAYWGGIHE